MTPKKEKRKCIRKPYDASIDYSLTMAKPDGTKAVTITETVRSVDISREGLGIVSGFPIRPDNVITVQNLTGARIPAKAVVRWMSREGIWYRIGLKFL